MRLAELVLGSEAVLAGQRDDEVLEGGVAALVVGEADGGLDLSEIRAEMGV